MGDLLGKEQGMSCGIVGKHRHQWLKRLKRKFLTSMPYGEWVLRKFL
jgi:hypothetical protein